MLYRGKGGNFAPDVPLVDAQLGKGLLRMGFFGDRAPGKAVFATPDPEHAMEYAGDGGEMLAVEPLPGARVTWAAGVGDLVVNLESWMRRRSGGGLSRQAELLLADVQGDSSTLETYLALGRQRRAIAEIVDSFVADLDVREVDARPGWEDSLEGHRGEVWITGPCWIESFNSLPKP